MTRSFTISQAVERYLKERKPDVSDSTLYNQRSALRQFKSFCDKEGVESADDIDAFLLSDFRLDRMEEVSERTVYNNIVVVRKFVRWCEGRDLVETGIADNMVLPEGRRSRNITIEPERVKKILKYLKTYEYATLRHALFALLWNTGIRIGAARSLNVSSVNEEQKYIEVRHRPEEGRPLKNGNNGERNVNISDNVAEILSNYIEARRIQSKDEHGNKPLFSTEHGRMHRNTLRKNIVALTRPCHYSNECPHGREIESCEANSYRKAAQCPSTISPHPIRRSAITYWLDEGHSKELLSDRMDVSVDVMEEHYDARSEEQKRELRREMLDIE